MNGAPERREERQEYGIPRRSRRLRGESLLLPGARGAGEDAVHLGSAKIQSSSAASDHEQCTAKARRTARARHSTSLPCRLRGESLLLPGARGAGEDAVHLGSAKIQSSSAASDHEQRTVKARRTPRARHSTSLPWHLRGESLLLPGARGAGEDAVHRGRQRSSEQRRERSRTTHRKGAKDGKSKTLHVPPLASSRWIPDGVPQRREGGRAHAVLRPKPGSMRIRAAAANDGSVARQAHTKKCT